MAVPLAQRAHIACQVFAGLVRIHQVHRHNLKRRLVLVQQFLPLDRVPTESLFFLRVGAQAAEVAVDVGFHAGAVDIGQVVLLQLHRVNGPVHRGCRAFEGGAAFAFHQGLLFKHRQRFLQRCQRRFLVFQRLRGRVGHRLLHIHQEIRHEAVVQMLSGHLVEQGKLALRQFLGALFHAVGNGEKVGRFAVERGVNRAFQLVKHGLRRGAVP